MFKSIRFLMTLITTLSAIAAASWWTYAVYLKPSRAQRQVNEAVIILGTNPVTSEWIRTLDDKSEEHKLILLSLIFRRKESGIDHALGLTASRSALDLAIYRGSQEARLELGKALRDGLFGKKIQKPQFLNFESH